MDYKPEEWLYGSKHVFVGGDSDFDNDVWTVGKEYTILSDVDTDDMTALFSSNEKLCDGLGGLWKEISCFLPAPSTTQKKYYVVACVRKSDKAVFMKDSSHKPYDNFESAKAEAERYAKDLSADYVYVVYELVPVMSAEKYVPPVKTKWF